MGSEELESSIADLCAGYQQAAIDQLLGKTKHLIRAGAYRSIGLSGGVSNNRALRSAVENLAKHYRMSCLLAQPKHTGDNAGMIAFAAYVDRPALASGGFTIEPTLKLADA